MNQILLRGNIKMRYVRKIRKNTNSKFQFFDTEEYVWSSEKSVSAYPQSTHFWKLMIEKTNVRIY